MALFTWSNMRLREAAARKAAEQAAAGELPPTPAAALPDGEVPPVVSDLPKVLRDNITQTFEANPSQLDKPHGRGHRGGR